MGLTLKNPKEMHAKAQESKISTVPIEHIPLWRTVVGFINNSSGNSRAAAPICGAYTTEYTIIPMSNADLDTEALRVKVELENAGYYVEIMADSISRFNEEALMIVCWDPQVISMAAKHAGSKTGNIQRGMCVLPDRRRKVCNGCLDCHIYYQKQQGQSSSVAELK